jgi:hypothetical protein
MTEQAKGRRGKKMLTAEQKYELWMSMVRGEGTQRELAARWGVDRSTVILVPPARRDGDPGSAGAARRW